LIQTQTVKTAYYTATATTELIADGYVTINLKLDGFTLKTGGSSFFVVKTKEEDGSGNSYNSPYSETVNLTADAMTDSGRTFKIPIKRAGHVSGHYTTAVYIDTISGVIPLSIQGASTPSIPVNVNVQVGYYQVIQLENINITTTSGAITTPLGIYAVVNNRRR